MSIPVVRNTVNTKVIVVDEHGKARHVCGAKENGKDSVCLLTPVEGHNRCYKHGGSSVTGIDSPQWRGRSYSKQLPAKYIDKLIAVVDDPDLTGLRHEIALTDIRIGEKLEELAEETSHDRWETVAAALDAAQLALNPPPPPALPPELEGVVDVEPVEANPREVLDQFMDAVKRAMDSANHDHTTWAEINALIEQRRRLASSEIKREELLAGQLTAKQAILLVSAIKTAIMDEVKDLEVRQKLLERIFLKILNREETSDGTPMVEIVMTPDQVQGDVAPLADRTRAALVARGSPDANGSGVPDQDDEDPDTE